MKFIKFQTVGTATKLSRNTKIAHSKHYNKI